MKRNCKNCKEETCNKIDPCKPTCSPCNKQEPIAYCGEDVACLSIKKGDSIHPIIKNIASVVCGVRNDVKAIKKESVPPIEVTYEELFILKNSGELKAGSFYLMTDFQTIYDQPDYSAVYNPKTSVVTKTSAVDPIILLAISTTEFAKEVWRPSTPRHTLEYDINFSKTEVMGIAAKGRITYCKDENNNETHYDHTVVLLKRYESVSGSGVYNTHWDTGFGSTEVLTFGSRSSSNKIGANYYEISGSGFAISNNVFGESAFGNIISSGSNNNTFGNHSTSNTFGNDTFSNTFGNNTYTNTFGNDTSGNTFGNNTSNITFGDNIYNIDFTTATHVYGEYLCNIFKRQDGTVRLSYYDNSDVLVVVNPTD